MGLGDDERTAPGEHHATREAIECSRVWVKIASLTETDQQHYYC